MGEKVPWLAVDVIGGGHERRSETAEARLIIKKVQPTCTSTLNMMALSTGITLTDLLSIRFVPIQDSLMALLDPLDTLAMMLKSKEINEKVNQKLKAG
jgi:hypothetical protein